MSALAALFHRAGGSVSRDSIERMIRAQSMFGGDFQKCVTYGKVALGCTLRWSVPEDVGVPQPVPGGEDRFAMIFDGRIDNREDLAGMLGLDANVFAELSDAQVVMRCYERWGREAFIRLVGDFALILWDKSEEQMLLVTGPSAVRGMVYYVDDTQFYAATMPRGLHALPEVPRELDEQKIADALCQLAADTTKSVFAGLKFVPGGSIMTVTADRITTDRYYHASERIKPVKYARDEDYVEAARELLNEAVRVRLRTNRKIGALMSGGLDSSTVAVTASAMLEPRGIRLPTFTSVPQDDWDGQTESHCYGDETPYVRAIADQHPNIELNLVQATGRGHYYRQDEFLRLAETPFRNAALLGWKHTVMEQAKSRDIGVMLVGDSGNMTLSYRGDGIYYDMFRRGRWITMLRELGHLQPGLLGLLRGFYGYVFSGFFTNDGWDKFMRLRGKQTLEQRWLRYSTARKSFGEAMRIPERARQTSFDYFGRPKVAGRSFWRERLVEDTAGFHVIGKAYLGMHGVEFRDPLGDQRLLEWCMGVPEEQFHRNGSPRWMIKRVMDGVLPDSVLYKKLLVGRINSDWQVRLAADLPRMREDIASMRDYPELDRMVDLDRLERWIDDWPDATVTDREDDRRFTLAVNLPMALNAARFVELVKGRNR